MGAINRITYIITGIILFVVLAAIFGFSWPLLIVLILPFFLNTKPQEKPSPEQQTDVTVDPPK